MNRFTLRDMSLITWYEQRMIIKDSDGHTLAEISNSQTRSEVYKPLLDRWVQSIGAIDDTLIVKVI